MSSSPAPTREGSFVILWAGENPVLHTTLLEKLDAAGIPYVDKAIGEDEVAPTADPLPIDWKPRFGFEVAVVSTDLDAAKAILDPLLDLELEPIVELPVKDDAVVKEQPPPESIAELRRFRCGPATSRSWRSLWRTRCAKTRFPRGRRRLASRPRFSFPRRANRARTRLFER